MRGHRAFRQLSILLARAGYHVLRFDYFGTGDSSGRSDEANTTQWIEDIKAAIDELKDMSAVNQIALIGTRLGAPLAVEAAAGRNDIAALALWDPVVSGAVYADELINGRRLDTRGCDSLDEVVAMVHGFPLTKRFVSDLRAVDLTHRTPAAPTRVVVSTTAAAYDTLRRAWPGVGYVHVPSKGNWNEVDNFGSALVPQEIIRNIVEWFGEGHAN